ncbi:mannose-binding protein C-like [Penaeus japonicus]|uniref:mannose-binding protein C-like n=1 Tax=Penaeus japonicus TaxID=27405 RepID=UPI001C71515E|nr:mannose-binding protein C-like [Penaeus japonicus]
MSKASSVTETKLTATSPPRRPIGKPEIPVGASTPLWLCLWYVRAAFSGHLNAGENSFLASLVTSGSFWLLADDASTEGVWENTDTDEVLPYANWIPGQPDNGGGNEDCAEINSNAEWNDLPCGSSRSYACQIPVAQCDSRKDDIRCSYLL